VQKIYDKSSKVSEAGSAASGGLQVFKGF